MGDNRRSGLSLCSNCKNVCLFFVKNTFVENIVLLVLTINSSFPVHFIHLRFLLIAGKDCPALKLD